MHKYPKLLSLLASCILAYVLYHAGFFDVIGHAFNGHGYVSMFLGGLLFSFGFTSPFALGIFVEMAPEVHPLLAAPIAGAGAFLMDFLIFEVIHFSFFHDELHRLSATRLLSWLASLLHHDRLPNGLKKYIFWSFAGLVIASPLPDEIGVTLISSITRIDPREFSILCFFLNTLGVLLILVLSRGLVT